MHQFARQDDLQLKLGGTDNFLLEEVFLAALCGIFLRLFLVSSA